VGTFNGEFKGPAHSALLIPPAPTHHFFLSFYSLVLFIFDKGRSVAPSPRLLTGLWSTLAGPCPSPFCTVGVFRKVPLTGAIPLGTFWLFNLDSEKNVGIVGEFPPRFSLERVSLYA